MTNTDFLLILGVTAGLIVYHTVLRPQLMNSGLIGN